MASFVPDSTTSAASDAIMPLMNRDEREDFLNQMGDIWSSFGSLYDRSVYYGVDPLPDQDPIQWDQVPSSSQPVLLRSLSAFFPPRISPPRILEIPQLLPQATWESVVQETVTSSTTPPTSSSPPEEPPKGNPPTISLAIAKCECSFRAGTPVPSMARHWARSCPDKPNLEAYDCDFCNGEINEEITPSDTSEMAYDCDLCDGEIHEGITSDDTSEMAYDCHLCSGKINERITSSDTSEMAYDCRLCDGEINERINSGGTSEMAYDCDLCSGEINEKITSSDTPEMVYDCDLCGGEINERITSGGTSEMFME
ncbi:hypothetical protein FRC01_006936 [Tulasnella sp. 417]|nr:hypothetical protein FRC01_006936 [Tulasnella sp. 417]